MISLIKKERFDIVMGQIESAGVEVAKTMHPEESKLRIEQPLVDGKSQYIFNLKEAVSGPREVSLDRNDVFVPTQMGILLGLRNDANPQIEKLYSFVPVNDGSNPSVHPVGFENEHAESIYAGFVQWIIDNNVVISSYPTEKFKYIPETQGAFVLDSSDNAVNEGIQCEHDMEKMLPLLLERITVAGTRDHKITLNFNAAGLTFPVTDGWTPYVVLYMDGYLVKGGCQYIDGINAWNEAVGKW